MRSKVFQRILDDMDKDPWWVKLKRRFFVEYYVIKCLGLIKYFKNKIQSGGGMVDAELLNSKKLENPHLND